jgi:hypothetical protein
MWPTRIELVLDCLSLYCNEAVEIIRPDVDETLHSIVRGMPHVKRRSLVLFGWTKRHRMTPPAFDLTDYS